MSELASFYINLTEAIVIFNKELSIEKILAADWRTGKLVTYFFD